MLDEHEMAVRECKASFTLVGEQQSTGALDVNPCGELLKN